ncbi:MAG TPA: peptide chain release factor N(5)-glutamine methyltransferase [Clostridiaceae bacterium]|nr:peptide chain release factor N(5)-glutamine methyltransferase [Clostridiaceae bacterium]
MENSLRGLSQKISELFTRSGLDDPWVETRFFLREVAGLTLEEQLAQADHPLAEETVSELWSKAKRRAAREPLAYITGEAWFYGRRFFVKAGLLVPRADSEVLIEAALDELRKLTSELPARSDKKPLRILDTCCGTGCLGLTLLAELNDMDIPACLHLIDLDDLALQTAKENADRLGLTEQISLEKADLWPARTVMDSEVFVEPEIRIGLAGKPEVYGRYDVILSNPPYILSADISGLMPEVAVWESKKALDGGVDGLEFYRRLAEGWQDYLSESGIMILELGAGQAEQVISLFDPAEQVWIRLREDYNGLQRALILKGHT